MLLGQNILIYLIYLRYLNDVHTQSSVLTCCPAKPSSNFPQLVLSNTPSLFLGFVPKIKLERPVEVIIDDQELAGIWMSEQWCRGCCAARGGRRTTLECAGWAGWTGPVSRSGHFPWRTREAWPWVVSRVEHFHTDRCCHYCEILGQRPAPYSGLCLRPYHVGYCLSF